MAPNKSKAPKGKAGNSNGNASSAAFSQASLTQLTAQIDRDLETRNVKNLNGNSNNNNNNNGGKRKRTDADDEETKTQKKQATTTDSPKSKRKEKKEKAPKSDASVPTTDKTTDKKTVMLDEIKLLGGDEEDLDLVAGIDSDAEEGGANVGGGKSSAGADEDLSLDAAFQSELAKFAAGLGFDEVRLEDEDDEAAEEEVEEQAEEEAEQEDEEDDDEEVEEDEDEEEEDEEEEEEEEEEEPAPPPAVISAPKPTVSTDPFLPRNPKFSQLMLEPRAEWFTADVGDLPAPISDDIGRYSHTIQMLKDYAETLVETDANAYRTITSASSSHRFMSTIMTSGTMSDKVSALTLEVQEAPIHNSKAFENLLALAGKRSRGAAIAALGALVDLLGNGVVLPSDRRLRSFHAQPALLGALQSVSPATASAWKPHLPLPGGITKAHLMLWKYEDWLKDAFFRMLQQLEVWCNDEIEYSRSRSLDFVFGLLRSKPEQEANLLRLLVNKLGDRERKIASRASYLLLQLLTTHPGMKTIVVQTIEQEILLRPGQSLRAKYYGINTLNQTILSNKEPAIADSLVRVYFELFLTLLKSGALGAIDIPGADNLGENAEAKKDAAAKDSKKKWKRSYNDKEKNKDGKKGSAADKNEGNEKDVSEKLVSALLTGVNRAIPFANTDNTTLEKHMDTLFRITHSSNFNTSIQALMLVQQVAGSKQIMVDRFYRTLYESLLDPRLVMSSKQGMYLNLLFRALKNDVDVRRVKAFVKRMLQIATLHQPPFICGVLFLVVELESTFPDLKALLNEPEFDDEDEEEYYRDVPEEGDEEEAAKKAAEDTKKAEEKKRAVYDGRKRDPSYSNAQQSCLWELVPYFHHFHPSVTAFATNLLVRQKSLPKPDMANHTLMHFLDKFVYRNAKSVDASASKTRGASIMQPVAASNGSTTGAAQIVAPSGTSGGSKQTVAINSAAFWGQKAENVAAEDIFFHTYFSQVGKQSQTSRAAKRAAKQEKAAAKAEAAAGAGEDGEDVSDAEEEEIWQALKGSRPDIEGEDEGADPDMDMDDDDDDDLEDLKDLLNMSDSDDDLDDDLDDEGGADDMDVDGSDGGVEFADFADFSDEEGGKKDDVEADEDGLVSLASKNGRKAGRERRKELKALPTFASADDYAEMLGQEEDEDY